MNRTAAACLVAAAAFACAGAALSQTTAPSAPGSGASAYVATIVEKACIPLIKGQDAKAVAAATGMKRKGDGLLLTLPGVERIALDPPTEANPTVCTLTVNYEMDQAKSLADALSSWAAAQTPTLAPLSTGYQPRPGVTSWSWTADTSSMHEGLVLNTEKTPDGKPLGHGYDVATVLFSLSGS